MAVCYAAESPAGGGWLPPSRDLGALLPLFSPMRSTMVRVVQANKLRVLASRLVESSPSGAVHFEAAPPCCAQPAERQSFLRHLSGWTCDYSHRSYHQCWQDRESQRRRSSWHRSFATHIRKGKRGQKHLEGTDPSSDGGSVREAALQAAIAQIEEAWGKETVMWMGRNSGRQDVAVISTGSLTLDIALGVGGVPRGRVIEIYGPEASGKTTLALHVIAEAQKAGGRCVFVDAEHALDQSFAERIGVDINNLLLSQPDTGEQALAITDTLIRSGSVDVVVVDSVAALVPKAELEGEMGDSHMALQARLMSQALRKLTHSVSRSQTTLIFINQIRSKLGTFGGFGGPQEVTSGGNALKFYASVRLNIRRTSLLKRGEETYGSLVTVKVAKNKLAPPFRTAEFEIEFDRGISREGEILDLGVKHGILAKSGAWFSYNKENFAMGKDNAKKHLRSNPEFRDKLLSLIKESVLDNSRSTSEPLAEADDSDDDASNDHFDEAGAS